MPRIRLALLITAPVKRCFDLARDIDLHQQSLIHTAERAVAGRTSGRIELGERVTWEAVHFGVRQTLTVQITDYARPYYFVDEMIHGAFARFTHRHEFAAVDAGTLMIDDFDYTAPFGPLGRLADRLILERYMRRLLLTRNAEIKRTAEQVSSVKPR
ncbi:MAG: hypothetical protein AVDCRST_MAG18-4905 [uncultured Thermomicrobiales bacterium]|uniref:Cell division inhibitor n=1 Tax=uncultured Thermomicrobiales bacterium TaxID=1645740 RepID=A0A6J4VX99_9BACT|nr:MAG: hypothetical protein AVDCRST_MAG18-4905 [uncultured Thermomicrobiales bacterium]